MNLEQLQEKERDLQRRIDDLNTKIGNLKKRKQDIQKGLQDIQKDIKLLNSDVYVTDHAIVRYFERCLGYNINEIKDIICPPNIKAQLKLLTTCKYPLKDFEIVVKDNKIVTLTIQK